MPRQDRRCCPVSLASEVPADGRRPSIRRELVPGSAGFDDIEHRLPETARSRLVERLHHLERHASAARSWAT